MWRDFLGELGLELREPAADADIALAERELGAVWPKELRELLLETDGVFDEAGFAVVRPVRDIVSSTRDMWRLDNEQLYMTLRPHLFFAQEANGDEYFYRVVGDERDWDVFAWLHEDDSRTNYAFGMRAYVIARVEESRKGFDPDFDNATLDAFFDTLAFLALSGEDVVHPEAAARQLESVAAALRAAPESQRRSFAGRAQGLAIKPQDPARAEFFTNVSRGFGLFPES